MRPFKLFWATLLFCGSLFAQPPQIFYRSVVNAAHFLPPGLPQGSVARGSVVSIFGARLGPATSPALAFPLSETLGGVSIRVSQGSTSVAGYPLFVSAGQINAIIPSNAPLGASSLTVTYNGRESAVAPIRIVNSSFGIYTALGTGNGPGIFQNFVSQAVQPVNAPATAARPGQVVTLWGTGLGPVTHADNIAPNPASLPTQAEVFVGGTPATISYSGRSPCCAGSDQIVFIVPANTPLGCWVPVEVRTEGRNVSNVVTMAISSDESPCVDSANPYAAAVRGGQKLGAIRLARSTRPVYGVSAATTPTDTTTDIVTVNLRQLPSTPFGFHPALSLPPAGTCTVDARALGSPTPALSEVRQLNAGTTLTVSAGAVSRTVALSAAAASGAQLGKSIPDTPTRNNLMLSPGSVSIGASGGVDVSAFQATATMPSPISWTNRSQITNVNRNQPLTISWSGSGGQLALVSGGAMDAGQSGIGEFACVAPTGASSFEIPTAILQAIPAGAGWLNVGSATLSLFNASGLDAGVAAGLVSTAAEVQFR